MKDNIPETTPAHDPLFMHAVEYIERCYRLNIFNNCSGCPDYKRCNSWWNGLSEISALDKLNQQKLEKALIKRHPKFI